MKMQNLIGLTILSLLVSVHSLTVTWNGTVITNPVLIYHDELVVDSRNTLNEPPLNGTLVCRSDQVGVGWYLPADPTMLSIRTDTSGSFRQIKLTSHVSTLSVTRKPVPDGIRVFINGIWTCRLGTTLETAIPVGIYTRMEGYGTIASNVISLISSSFMTDTPTFTLSGNTSGGPPTTYTWTRNGEQITKSDGGPYNISIEVNGNSVAILQQTHYRSTLTVTGRLPGVYQYSVTNRATTNMVTNNISIEGAPPTNVTAVQTGLARATVMWTPPPAPPAAGYQVQVTPGDIDRTANTSKTSLSVLINSQTEYGMYHIQVKSLSRHFPGEATEPVDITIRGPLPPVIFEPSPTGSSVAINWTQPEFSLQVANYTVTLTLSNSNISGMEPQLQQMTTSSDVPTVTFRGLKPLSNYTVSVMANFQPVFGISSLKRMNTTEFTTLDSGSSSSAAQIASAVIVIIVVAIVIIVILYLWKRYYKRLKFNLKSLTSKDPKFIYEEPITSEVMEKHNSKPMIEEFPADTVAIEGEGVFFQVIVKGRPQPSLTWYHQDTQLTPDYSLELQQDGSLSITSTELRHSGVYRLLAKNCRGSAEREVRLTVRQEEEPTAMQVDKKKVELKPVPLAEFGDYVAQNHSNLDEGFKFQYHSLDTGDEHAKTVGTSKKYVKLNRFNNITVYDHNRIILSPLSDFEEYQQEFINACFINGYIKPQKFIATQGPNKNILVDFWRLVWQEKPPTIVMVTNLKEGNKRKCEQYWPDDGRKSFGPFRVTLKEQQIFADYTIRTLHITLERSTERALKVKQFQYTSWPDHGVPEYATSILSFHRRVISQHKVNKGPILVHCSAGVGRTGTFICIDYVLEQTKKENMVDIAGAINKMRHQRMIMVQTPEQYVFIHDAILESMTCGDTEISLADLKLAMTKLSKINQDGTTMFQTQFHVLDQVSPKQSEMVCSDALKHLKKNRCDQFLPSNKNRVILSGECPDYIHAVSANGYKQKKAYIIAEGPMASTTRNMWKVVYDRKCGVVVMLSDLVENGMESCFQYWPAVGQFAKFGEYKVKLINEEPLEGFIIRTMSVLHERTQKTHQVTQFHITCWTRDGRCSNLRAVVDVIEEVAKVQRRTGNKPMFVHCSDTVTRSGMFCAMATVIDRCKTEGVVDVFQVVKALRTSKPGAVPTEENYRTIFDATVTFLDSFDTYANFQN